MASDWGILTARPLPHFEIRVSFGMAYLHGLYFLRSPWGRATLH
jgi:hypothetical protein